MSTNRRFDYLLKRDRNLATANRCHSRIANFLILVENEPDLTKDVKLAYIAEATKYKTTIDRLERDLQSFISAFQNRNFIRSVDVPSVDKDMKILEDRFAAASAATKNLQVPKNIFSRSQIMAIENEAPTTTVTSPRESVIPESPFPTPLESLPLPPLSHRRFHSPLAPQSSQLPGYLQSSTVAAATIPSQGSEEYQRYTHNAHNASISSSRTFGYTPHRSSLNDHTVAYRAEDISGQRRGHNAQSSSISSSITSDFLAISNEEQTQGNWADNDSEQHYSAVQARPGHTVKGSVSSSRTFGQLNEESDSGSDQNQAH